jgi:hypothetical protein
VQKPEAVKDTPEAKSRVAHLLVDHQQMGGRNKELITADPLVRSVI